MTNNLPIEIIQRINEYIPKDKNMSSPTSTCIKPRITDYNYEKYNNDWWINRNDPFLDPEFDYRDYPYFPSFLNIALTQVEMREGKRDI